MRKSNKYVNNARLYEEFKNWDYEKEMPKYIAESIMQICNNLARMGCFSGYSWKEECIGDAIMLCVKGARNFDTNKSNNPFAYFTSVAYNAFRRRINIEKGSLQLIKKYKSSIGDGFFDTIDGQDFEFVNNNIILNEYNNLKNDVYLEKEIPTNE